MRSGPSAGVGLFLLRSTHFPKAGFGFRLLNEQLSGVPAMRLGEMGVGGRRLAEARCNRLIATDVYRGVIRSLSRPPRPSAPELRL
jgi:hypothetical protein